MSRNILNKDGTISLSVSFNMDLKFIDPDDLADANEDYSINYLKKEIIDNILNIQFLEMDKNITNMSIRSLIDGTEM